MPTRVLFGCCCTQDLRRDFSQWPSPFLCPCSNRWNGEELCDDFILLFTHLWREMMERRTGLSNDGKWFGGMNGRQPKWVNWWVLYWSHREAGLSPDNVNVLFSSYDPFCSSNDGNRRGYGNGGHRSWGSTGQQKSPTRPLVVAPLADAFSSRDPQLLLLASGGYVFLCVSTNMLLNGSCFQRGGGKCQH